MCCWVHACNWFYNHFSTGAKNPTWKKRYFKLAGDECSYLKTHTSEKTKGDFKLTKARGVRRKEECWDKVDWPRKVGDDRCFAVSTEERTYYFYADSEKSARYNIHW